MRKNELVSLLLNASVVVLSIIGFVLTTHEGIQIFEYYTQNSNLLACISSLLFIIFVIAKKEINNIPFFVMALRYISTCCLELTFIVVVAILAPTMSNNYFEGLIYLLTNGSMLFHHLLCPIISLISFIFFEGDRRLNKKKTIWLALIPTLIYGFIMMLLNVLKVVEGPYPFLMVYNQKWYMSIIWIIVIFVVDYIISRNILLFNQIRAPRIKLKRDENK